MKKNDYIVEFIRVGDYVKVSAIDPRSNQEACIVAPAKGVTEKRMKEIAIRKLQYVINKKHVET